MLPVVEQKPQIEIAKALAATPECFGKYVDMLLAGRPAGAALVLFADQLEELFTVTAEKDRGTFAGLLARAADYPRVRMLATLRADFLPKVWVIYCSLHYCRRALFHWARRAGRTHRYDP